MTSLILLLVVAAYAQANVLPENTAYGYIEKSFAWAEKLRQLEDEESNTRVIGGSAAALGQFPYQVGLLSNITGFPQGNGICGGSLLNANRVLTAAHCWFDGFNQGWLFNVVLGSVTIWNGGTRIQTSTVVMHPNWFPLLARNDVAVIYLPTSVSFSNTISPVSLPIGPELEENFAGDRAVASGFGAVRNGTGASPTLNHVTLSIMTNTACRPSFPIHLQDNNICTSGSGIVGVCQGDSGGPLVVERGSRRVLGNNICTSGSCVVGVCQGGSGGPLVVKRGSRRVLVGVTSFGPGAAIGCEGGAPSVYARVTSFNSFILQNLA